MGAARRLEELRQEEAEIRAAFPDLEDERESPQGRRAPHSRSPKAKQSPNDAAGAAARTKRRYKMSAAQKRVVSERMKRYWAMKRKAKG